MSVFSTDNAAARREAEANRFAAGVLMPAPHFRRDIQRLGEPELEHVFTLAEQYEASREAIANRYVEFAAHPCAFVFSLNGKVRYSRKTDTFPWLSQKKGDDLPDGSLSAGTAHGRKRVPSSWAQVPGEIWLQDETSGAEILEQTVAFSGGYRITLLQIEVDETLMGMTRKTMAS